MALLIQRPGALAAAGALTALAATGTAFAEDQRHGAHASSSQKSGKGRNPSPDGPNEAPQAAARGSSGPRKDIEEVVVTSGSGYREATQAAQGIKRFADSVVDAIAATGLGRFADTSVGDAMQRIPAVQIQRNDGGQEGDRASIRGLGPIYVNTTINGRTPLSSGTEGLNNLRSFNFDVIPTSLISGVVVKKTPTAGDVESGLAGLVEIQTRKPLFETNYKDNKDYFGLATLQANRGSIGRRIGPRATLMVGGRNSDRSLGAYVMGMVARSFPGRNQLFPQLEPYDLKIDNSGDGRPDQILNGVYAPGSIDFEPVREERQRYSLAGAVQWRPPVDNLEISLDGFYSYYDNTSVRNRVAAIFGEALKETVFSPNQIFVDSANTLQSVAPNALRDITAQFVPFFFGNRTHTTVTGINFDYKPMDTLRAKLDVSYSRVDYTQDLDAPVLQQTVPGSQVSFDTNNGLFRAALGPLPQDRFIVAPYLPPAQRGGLYARDIFLDGQELGTRLDFEQTLEFGILKSVEYGARWTRADVDSIRTEMKDIAPHLGPQERVAISRRAIDPSQTRDYRFFTNKNVWDNSFPVGNLDQVYAAVPELGMRNPLLRDGGRSFAYVEDTLAFYAESNLKGVLLDHGFSGNFGLRLVRPEVAGEGVAVHQDGSQHPSSATNAYWSLLPSANFSFHLLEALDSDDPDDPPVLVLRLGVGRVLSRPNPSDLVPRSGAPEPEVPGAPWIGNLGNPFLKPALSWNYDATLEYYTPNKGSFIVSTFYKDVSDFVLVDQYTGLLPGFIMPVLINQPKNMSDGRVLGFELGLNQPFTFLPGMLSGFGLQANYTHVRSSFDAAVDDGGYGFPGASRNNFNAIAYYEKENFGIRVAYVYRDDFFRNLPGQGSQAESTTAGFTEGNGRVNVNATLHLTPNFSVFADVNNLFAEGRRDFLYQRSTFNGAFEREATATLGVTGTY